MWELLKLYECSCPANWPITEADGNNKVNVDLWKKASKINFTHHYKHLHVPFLSSKTSPIFTIIPFPSQYNSYTSTTSTSIVSYFQSSIFASSFHPPTFHPPTIDTRIMSKLLFRTRCLSYIIAVYLLSWLVCLWLQW